MSTADPTTYDALIRRGALAPPHGPRARGGVDGAPAALPQPREDCPPAPAGVSSGVNLEPGSNDDGWEVPPPVRLSDGTDVRLYKDGEALHAGFEAIRAAERRVCLETYIFADDRTGHAFADLLCEKARAGVSVYCIYDSFGSLGAAGLWRAKPEMFAEMARCGVRLQEFHPVRPWEGRFSWRPANRDHRKMIVVDDLVAGMGGLNIGTEYAGSWVGRAVRGPTRRRGKLFGSKAPSGADASCDFWRDTGISFRGPGAHVLLRSFARTWNYLVHGGRIGRAELRHALAPADGPLGVLASVPTLDSPLRPFLCHLFRSARASIAMTMAYFAPDEDLVRELIAAAKRGVRVRLVLPGRSDVKALIVAARSFYERLMDAGVEVYERQGAVLHAKTMVIDGHTSVVGSANLDARSTEFNTELSAIVRDDTFGRQMLELFENDVRFSKRIDPAEWRSRPWRDRAIQWAVIRGRYLL